MNLSQTALLLSLASAYDQRTIGDADVAAWHALLTETSFEDAQVVVQRHYATKRERLVPVDVLEGVKAIRSERLERYEAWVQPDPDLSPAQYRDWLVATRRRIADGWVPPEPAALDHARRAQLDAALDGTFPAPPAAPEADDAA